MMSDLLIEISKKALSLPPDERVQLAEDLLSSLHGPADPDVQVAWDAEISRRLEEVQAGTAKLVPAADVFAEARRLIAR